MNTLLQVLGLNVFSNLKYFGKYFVQDIVKTLWRRHVAVPPWCGGGPLLPIMAYTRRLPLKGVKGKGFHKFRYLKG